MNTNAPLTLRRKYALADASAGAAFLSLNGRENLNGRVRYEIAG
jgi:hypothetical protein